MNSRIERILVGEVEPQKLGIKPYKAVKVLARPAFIIGTILLATSVPLFIVGSGLFFFTLVAGVASLIAVPLAVRAWKSVLASGIDQELPALLSYILPYSHTPRHIVDLIITLPRDIFKWTLHEAERLKILLDEGQDPLSALRLLAETTPSRRLREVILDYATAHSLGAPRSQTTLLLLNHAVAAVRMKWKTHVETGTIVAELTATAIIAGSAMTPIAMLTGGNILLISIFAILTPLIGGLGLLLTRPVIGDMKPSSKIYMASPALLLIVSVLLLNKIIMPSLVILAITATIIEAIAYWNSKAFESSIQALRIASERSKYGMGFEDTLRNAEKAASGVIRAIIQSASIAGRLGVGEAISRLYQIIEEALNSVRSAKVQALLMAFISTAAPPIALYAVKFMEDAASTASDLLVGIGSIETVKNVLLASSVLSPLPAAIVHRGWVPSFIPSLASLVLSLYVLGLL